MTNKEKYKKAFDVFASSETFSLEVKNINEKRNKKINVKKIAAVVAICFVLAGTGTGVYAAAKYFGILDFSNRTAREIPDEAKEQIQTDIKITKEENDTIFDYSVKEALCDSQSITLVYEVSAKEKSKYLFVPEDAIPTDPMSDWSTITGKTAREYASEKNLTIVNIGGGITNRDDLGIAEQSMDFVSVSDDVMDIFIQCDVAKSAKTMDVEFTTTARQTDSENVMRLDSGFTLQDASTTTMDRYISTDRTPEESFYKIKNADVVQTDLGTYVDIYYTNKHVDNPEDGLMFRIVDGSGKEYNSLGGSGVERVSGNLYKTRCNLSKCEIGDVLHIEAFDCNEKTVYGVSELNMESK